MSTPNPIIAEQLSRGAIEGALRALAREIHAAGASHTHWCDVAANMNEVLNARSVVLGQHKFSSGQGVALYNAPFSEAFRRDYAAFSARDPWFLSSDDYTVGRVMTGEEVLENRELLRTDFYRGFLKPYSLFHRLCGVVARRLDFAYFIAAHRGEDQEPFGERERESLRFLVEHVMLATENHWQLLSATELAGAMMGIIDQNPNAIFLVSPDGNIIYQNLGAGALLARGAALRVDSSRLAAVNSTHQRALRQAILGVTEVVVGRVTDESLVISLDSTNDQEPIVAIVRAAGEIFLAELGKRTPLATVTVRVGPVTHNPTNCYFAKQFGLTPAQAKVSALVFMGQSVTTAASSLYVSENTVRSHLKQVFQKTNTHGQMELFRLHARVCSNHI